ncbi:NUDIX hydrolase [Crenobacter cavernae]|uniref:DUF4743 domain-containing protein n=1 Tax=Crenobacter cavernae TaxID=2290923 RepID=A0ABY0FI43_9NEIS|nr:DUF4743 domain-containing protein [Crenobacter cavernae]RXZ44783.1 DUF4743 domain-containing protein [Crenobacter cavernae]
MLVEEVIAVLGRATHIDRSAFTPLIVAGQKLGCVNAVWRERLLGFEPALFEEKGGSIACRIAGDAAQLTRELNAAAERWQAIGWLNGWRNERFTAFGADGTALFELERAAFRPLGLTSRAVHLNGLTRLASGEVRMWIARRSPHKGVEPNRMDNLMGGGVAAGESLQQALLREGWEEAGMSAGSLTGLAPASLLLAERPVQRGVHREWLYAYDVWLADGERPANQDGEVAEHVLLPLHEVEDLLVAERFMIDAALVASDCLARLGYWGDESARVEAALAAVRHPVDAAVHAL